MFIFYLFLKLSNTLTCIAEVTVGITWKMLPARFSKALLGYRSRINFLAEESEAFKMGTKRRVLFIYKDTEFWKDNRKVPLK